ncbi:MAG: hypothetical protein RIT81_01025 [Deltaproteobacteria bacterium]
MKVQIENVETVLRDVEGASLVDGRVIERIVELVAERVMRTLEEERHAKQTNIHADRVRAEDY